jgi:uncharacterized protein YndB with AHSA1/START domain
MLTAIAVVAALLIVGLLVFAATKPDTFRVERTAVINAPPEKIFAVINDFHKWNSWSPWEKLDPGMKRTHTGSSSGKGSVYAWEGNKKVGAGRMEITETSSPSQVVIKLDFLKPFEAHNVTEFTVRPNGQGTNVTWKMQGPYPYMMKVVSIFSNMDKAIGKDFAAGLTNLKSIAEKS